MVCVVDVVRWQVFGKNHVLMQSLKMWKEIVVWYDSEMHLQFFSTWLDIYILCTQCIICKHGMCRWLININSATALGYINLNSKMTLFTYKIVVKLELYKIAKHDTVLVQSVLHYSISHCHSFQDKLFLVNHSKASACSWATCFALQFNLVRELANQTLR